MLSKKTGIGEFYSKLAGVIEGYTVGQHTEMVLELAQKYRAFFERQISEHMAWEEFLLFLALHDIGKGVSKEYVSNTSPSAKELELKASQQILTTVCEKLWIRSCVGNVFQAMLMYDSQGDYLKGDINAETFKDHILNMSAVCNLKPHAFYQIYSVFHIIDAASYPNLKPLFIFDPNILRHCEGNQLLIDHLQQSL